MRLSGHLAPWSAHSSFMWARFRELECPAVIISISFYVITFVVILGVTLVCSRANFHLVLWWAYFGGHTGHLGSLQWAYQFPPKCQRTHHLLYRLSYNRQGVQNADSRNHPRVHRRWYRRRYFISGVVLMCICVAGCGGITIMVITVPQ